VSVPVRVELSPSSDLSAAFVSVVGAVICHALAMERMASLYAFRRLETIHNSRRAPDNERTGEVMVLRATYTPEGDSAAAAASLTSRCASWAKNNALFVGLLEFLLLLDVLHLQSWFTHVSFLTRNSHALKSLWHGLSCVCLSVVCNECIVAKRWEIWPRLLLINNRKSHTGF